jgi:hypothetical protein
MCAEDVRTGWANQLTCRRTVSPSMALASPEGGLPSVSSDLASVRSWTSVVEVNVFSMASTVGAGQSSTPQAAQRESDARGTG